MRYRLCLPILLCLLVTACALLPEQQGHSTFTTVFAAVTAAVAAFFLAPLEALVAILGGIALAFVVMAYSPKYPLLPPRDPQGHVVVQPPPPTPWYDKTLYELILEKKK